MNLPYEAVYTLRLVRRKYGFSALCITVIAIGYLITLPLFSFVKNFAYTTLPYPDGERLVVIKPFDDSSQFEMAAANHDAFQFNFFKASLTSFESLGAYQTQIVSLSDGELAEQFLGYRATANVLDFTSVPPLLGRRLSALDEVPGAEPVVLIGYQVWQNYYAGDPRIIGKTARVNSQLHTIVGVMPADFRYPTVSDMWLPLSISAAAEPGEGPNMTIVGLLEEGISRSDASEEARITSQLIARDYPDHYENRSALVKRFTQSVINNGMIIFDAIGTVAIGLFLLICLNISNLLMIRANERVAELAIRSALGAKRIGLFLHVLFESFFICMAGTIIGVTLAAMVLNRLESFFSTQLDSVGGTPFWINFSFNLDELVVSISMLVILWLLSGAFAAWRGSQGDLNSLLNSDSKNLAIGKGGNVTRFFVHLQISISFFLLILSGLFLLSFQSSERQSAVVEPEKYLIGSVSVDTMHYTEPRHSDSFRRELKDLLEAQPEFVSVAFDAVAPGNAAYGVRVSLENDNTDITVAPQFGINWIDENFFNTIGFPMLEGRNIESADNLESPNIVVVDETFRSRLQLDSSPIGQTIRLYDYANDITRTVTIVGVVPQTNNPEFKTPQGVGSRIYAPLSQNPNLAGFQFVTKLSESAITQPLAEIERRAREAAADINRDITLYQLMLLSTPIEANISTLRVFLAMFAAAAIGALMISVISIYGLISRSIFARTGEIGIRRALGASDLRIMKIFVNQGFTYLFVALVIGGGLGALAMNLVQSSLTVISGFSAIVMFSTIFATVTAVVTALVFIASYVPTRRLVTMEPGDALHYE